MTQTINFTYAQATVYCTYVDSAAPTTNYYLSDPAKADSNAASSGTGGSTKAIIMQFTIPSRDQIQAFANVSAREYISTIKLNFDLTTNGTNIDWYKVGSSYENIAFDKVCYNTFNQTGNLGGEQATWDPAHFNGTGSDGAEAGTQHLVTTSTKSPAEGDILTTLTVDGTSTRTCTIGLSKIKEAGYDFGSKVTLIGYNEAATESSFQNDGGSGSPTFSIVTLAKRPLAAALASEKSGDGTTSLLTVALPNDDTINEYYYVTNSSGSQAASATKRYDTNTLGIKTISTDSLTTSFAQGANFFVRVFTENAEFATTNATAGEEVVLFRPSINAAILYTDSALSSALAGGSSPTDQENVTLGQKVYLKVTDSAVAAASTGNKYTKIRVNWDSGTTDTDEDYAVYDMVDLSPVLNNGSNTVVSHIYHTAGAKVVKVQVEDENGFRSDKGNITGNQPDVKVGFPKAIMSTSSTKITQAKYGDRTTAVTLSGQQSKTSGSDKLIDSYGWGYTAGLGTTIVTANALENDNSVFDNGSKQVKIGALSYVNNDDTVFKIFGLASFRSTGVGVVDTDTTNFDHYAYTSATASPLAFDINARPNIGAVAEDAAENPVFFKEIECVVCITKADYENGTIFDCARYILVTDDSPNQIINSNLFYDSNVVASLPALGDTVNETLTATDETITRGISTNSDTGNIIKVNSEDMFIHFEGTGGSANDILVARGYNNTTAVAHASGSPMLEYRTANRYKWGGYAKVRGANIDFTASKIIIAGVIDTLNSSGENLCWLDNGFYVGDVIKVATGTSANGTYALPKYYKIDSFTLDGDNYDEINIVTDPAELSESERTYIETTMTVDTSQTIVEVLRYDSTRKPSISAAIYNTASASDTVTFYMSVFDNTQARWNAANKSATTDSYSLNYHWAETTADVQAIFPSTLDLDTLADAKNIAIEKVNITRSGGITAQMPLGIRRYPVGVVRTKLGVPKVSIQAKALTQVGYRALFSLVEGNRYDYVFLDSKKLDSPATSYRTLRMRLEAGNITKDTSDPNVYQANLTFVIVGEDVS
jgi:hypothetical protein